MTDIYAPTRTRIAQPAVRATEFKLAGRHVTQAIYYQAHNAKRAGQRVFLVTAGSVPGGPPVGGDDDCPNCSGFGRMALETAVGGPFTDVPTSGERGEGNAKVYVSAVTKGKDWYQVTRDYFDCPVCRREVQL